MTAKKYIPYLSYIDICRVLCAKTESPTVRNEAGYETFFPPMDCFYARSFITAETFDLPLIAGDLAQKIEREGYPDKLSFFAEDAPENYAAILQDAGFVPGFRQEAMVGCLDRLNPFPDPPKGDARLIRPEELEEWKQAMTTGFGKGDMAPPGLYEALLDTDNVFIYGWFVNGKIVGTMIAVENGDITGLHEGTVLPEYRRQGIITALILAGAKDLRPRGVKTASMQASVMGSPVYASLGFTGTGFIETWIFRK